MTEREYTWNGTTHPIGKPHLTDEEMAGEVRMLMRDQLDHEAICTAARDRIMCLVAEKKALQEALESVASPVGFMRRQAEATGDRFDGHAAVYISKDPEFLKGIAQDALNKIQPEST